MSDKVADLINNVKELIQDGNKSTDKCIKDIENEIDSKENQIRELFADNIDSVISHYLQYHETLSHHKRLEADCEEFTKHIEKAHKLNAYDEQMIEKTEKNLEIIKNIKNKLNEYRNHVKLAKKAAISIKEEKYNNAIKYINEIKRNPPKSETPLSRVVPLIEKKVEEHLKKLLESFWEENKKKMLDIGKNCFQRMSSNLLQKMNIYQIFFGESMTRSSLMNTSSLNAFRCTVLQKQNSSRISKTSEQTEQYFNKMMVRVSVEMSTIKKVRTMVVELNNQGIFNQMLRSSMREYLGLMQSTHCCEKEQEFVSMLSELIGLMLVKRQVCAFFDLKLDEKVFLSQMYIFIGREIKSLSFIIKNAEISITLKEHFLIFHRILNILKLNESNQNYNAIITAILKTYNEKNLEVFDACSAKEIASDNLTHFCTDDKEKENLIREMLDLGSQQFKFTSYVIFVLEYFLKTYNQITKLIEESDINPTVIFQAIRNLYDRVLKVYGAEVLAKDQHYEIIQGEVNINHLNKIYKYLLRQLSIYHGVVTNNSLEDKYQQLIVKLTRNILEVIRQKLVKLMEDYNQMSGTTINSSYNQFVEWTLEFIYHIILFMKEINCPNYESITIETMREMCELYWEYLKGLKEYNLIIIHNLDVDLSFIYRYCAKNFAGNIVLLDKFKSLRQFYALMLTNNIQDLLDPQKRVLSYPNLDMEVLIPMLKKYAQAKSTGGKIRELKKKDVEALVKKLLVPQK